MVLIASVPGHFLSFTISLLVHFMDNICTSYPEGLTRIIPQPKSPIHFAHSRIILNIYYCQYIQKYFKDYKIKPRLML